MRKIDYNKRDKNTGATETHVAVDESIKSKYGNVQYAYNEGFASSDGVRGGTAETNGKDPFPDRDDTSRPHRVPDDIEKENPGLADN